MRRSTIDRLPLVAREQIERAIRESGFSGYVELADKLKAFGKGISKSSLHRFAVRMREMDERARFEAEVMRNLGSDASFLLRWARAYPKQAARLVERLKTQSQSPKTRKTQGAPR